MDKEPQHLSLKNTSSKLAPVKLIPVILVSLVLTNDYELGTEVLTILTHCTVQDHY